MQGVEREIRGSSKTGSYSRRARQGQGEVDKQVPEGLNSLNDDEREVAGGKGPEVYVQSLWRTNGIVDGSGKNQMWGGPVERDRGGEDEAPSPGQREKRHSRREEQKSHLCWANNNRSRVQKKEGGR